MDSFEWNKVAAAILIGLLLFMGVTLLSEAVYEHDDEVIFASGEDTGEAPAPVDEGPSFDTLLIQAAGSPDSRAFRKCQACHNANDGGAHQIGPNLWNIVAAPVAGKAGYSYSSAMVAKGGTWTYEALNSYLTRPAADVPGTKMSFAGIRTVEERAQVIAFLRSMSNSPAALPEASAQDEGGEVTEEAGEETTEAGAGS